MRVLGGLFLVATAAAFAATSVQAADTITYNSDPSDSWYRGSGNDYVPANTAVFRTGDGNEIYLRFHETFVAAPASDAAGVYSFALGTTPISFDWGIDANNGEDFSGLGALLRITNLTTGSQTSVDPFAFPDNEFRDGSAQNSARLNWFTSVIDFDPNVDNTFRLDLEVSGFNANSVNSLSIFAKLGDGAGAVPEPATWAMMILGLGLVGARMRRRRTSVSFI